MKTAKPFDKPWVVCVIAVFCNMLWGSAFPFVKRGYYFLQLLPPILPRRFCLPVPDFFSPVSLS